MSDPRLWWGVLLLFSVTLASAQTLHDPMQPDRKPSLRRSAAPSAPSLRLESTFVREGQSVAVINGRAWTLGELHRGIRLLAVEPGRARVSWRGEQIVLEMPQAQVRNREGGG